MKTINPLHIPHSFQKQPSSGLLRKMSCDNMITLWNGCSPVHLLHTSDAFQPLTIITKRSILNVAAVLDPLLVPASFNHYFPKPPKNNLIISKARPFLPRKVSTCGSTGAVFWTCSVNSSSEKFHKFHKKTLVFESWFYVLICRF